MWIFLWIKIERENRIIDLQFYDGERDKNKYVFSILFTSDCIIITHCNQFLKLRPIHLTIFWKKKNCLLPTHFMIIILVYVSAVAVKSENKKIDTKLVYDALKDWIYDEGKAIAPVSVILFHIKRFI